MCLRLSDSARNHCTLNRFLSQRDSPTQRLDSNGGTCDVESYEEDDEDEDDAVTTPLV